ncbi:ApaLI family restriction endonuclease [Anabaena sp. FACHB-1237]|uniref:ApaLI family restriction endonuclease n=1 Tax=Anabaena sp. FACHB-1237 TaxID=2692769 RepID=UPI0018EF899C|nr:ApaLI family restriction endonuclease [Anabaena sp. FACHB-1237]
MSIEMEIKMLADKYALSLNNQINKRIQEMKLDDKSHYLIYTVLGISEEEGELIDIYQNKGRFLYKYAGAFLEEAAILCFKTKFPDAAKDKIKNSRGKKTKTI